MHYYFFESHATHGFVAVLQVRMQDTRGASDLSASVSTQQNGGILHHPIPGDMLRLAYNEPQVGIEKFHCVWLFQAFP